MELTDLATYDIVVTDGTVYDFMLTLFDDNDDIIFFPEETTVLMRVKLLNRTEMFEGTYKIERGANPVSSFFIQIPRTHIFDGDIGDYSVDYTIPAISENSATETKPARAVDTKRIIRGEIVIEKSF